MQAPNQQCDQIWRNFATLDIVEVYLSIWQNFEPTLANFYANDQSEQNFQSPGQTANNAESECPWRITSLAITSHKFAYSKLPMITRK